MTEVLSQQDIDSLYYIIGVIVIMNISAIGGAFALMIKLAFKAGEYNTKFQKMERDIHAAHEKLRESDGK